MHGIPDRSPETACPSVANLLGTKQLVGWSGLCQSLPMQKKCETRSIMPDGDIWPVVLGTLCNQGNNISRRPGRSRVCILFWCPPRNCPPRGQRRRANLFCPLRSSAGPTPTTTRISHAPVYYFIILFCFVLSGNNMFQSSILHGILERERSQQGSLIDPVADAQPRSDVLRL